MKTLRKIIEIVIAVCTAVLTALSAMGTTLADSFNF